jgi:transcriptional regulator with XRE-family HTH domain
MEILKKAIKESGMTQQFIADKLDISRISLYNKLNDEYPFTFKEIKILVKLLNLNDFQILAIMKED